MTFINIYYLFDCFLFIRIISQWSDERIESIQKNISLVLIEIFLLLPLLTSWSFIVVIIGILLIYHLVLYRTEKYSKNIFLGRIIQLIVLIFSSSFLLGLTNQEIIFNAVFLDFLCWLLRNNILTQYIVVSDLKILLIYIFGLMITVMELNHIIRAILKSIKASPVKKTKNAVTNDCADFADVEDVNELKRGKIIGAIERVLFFFFVLTGNYTSIGFILAAKGITRFKELDDKDFAEYVLIGTLLSSSLSIFCAEIIKKVINIT